MQRVRPWGPKAPPDKARRRLVRFLTERWREYLPGGRIPTTLLRKLEKSTQFRRWIDQLQDDRFTLPEVVTRVVRGPDGGRLDLLAHELGGDPLQFICKECGEDVEQGKTPCAACETFKKGE